MQDKQNARRAFARTMAAAGAALLAGGAHAAPVHRGYRRAPRLREGDTVALVTPSGHIDDERLQRAIANVAGLGLRAKIGAHVRELRGNFAGPAAHRIDDLNAALRDPDVKAVWPVHGGSGAIALLPHVDYAALRRQPKIVIGYSDVTALLLAVHRQAGLVTFHAPNAGSLWTPYTQAHLRAVLMQPQAQYTMTPSAEMAARAAQDPLYQLRTVHEGVAQGRLIGGNLSLASALAGTPFAAQLAGRLVFLEDIGEAPYRVDRMLNQLHLGAGLHRASGVMLGVFEKCGPPDADPSLSLAETVDDHLLPLTRPAVYGYSFGHIRDQCVLPLGTMARLDTAARTLTLLEPAVG
jgi:muramoyltetrapeptide carboxypeptidase